MTNYCSQHKLFLVIFQGWETLTNAVVKHISEHCSGVVFLLWGSYAQKKADIVDKKRHHLLKSVHPSPLSAHRGFLGCKHFSKCNELLLAQEKTPIDWKKLDDWHSGPVAKEKCESASANIYAQSQGHLNWPCKSFFPQSEKWLTPSLVYLSLYL